jgi:hypothetical protein
VRWWCCDGSDAPLFVEQLAVPALLVGGGALAFGLFRDLSVQGGAAVLCAVALGVAAVLPQGRGCACCSGGGGHPAGGRLRPRARVRSRHAVGVRHRMARRPSPCGPCARVLPMRTRGGDGGAFLEPVAAGWLLAALAGLAWWSGLTFLVGASAGGGLARARSCARSAARRRRRRRSACCRRCRCCSPAQRRRARRSSPPELRRAWCAGVAAMLLVLAWFMPALGRCCWPSCCARQRAPAARRGRRAGRGVDRGRLLLRAGLAAGHQGRGAGRRAAAWLGAMAWWGGPAPPRRARRSAASGAVLVAPAAAGIALAALATLVVANTGIWQKERLIARGQRCSWSSRRWTRAR